MACCKSSPRPSLPPLPLIPSLFGIQIVIGMFVAFGGVLFGYELIPHGWSAEADLA